MRVRLPHGFTPRDYQRRYMGYYDHGGKRGVWVWHRRAGKDVTALHQTVKMAHERKGMYWHCLPTYRQAKKAIWDGFTRDGKRIIDAVFPPAIVKRKNESEMLVELKCGSMVQLVGSDTIDNLVGAGPAGVTFSEFSISKPKAWDLVRPMLAENDGWASFIFTPRGNNHGKQVYDSAEKIPGWKRELLTIHDTNVLPASLLDEERAAGMPEALIRQEYLCDFTAALVGSVWGDLVEALEKSGAMNLFDHGTDGVFTTWDLGMDDSTSIWCWRVGEDGIDFIDHYEAHGKPMPHYFDWVEARGYRYVKHVLPHDAKARSLQTGVGIIDQAIARFGAGMLDILPPMSLADGIQAVRWLLQRNVRFHPRTKDGVEALKQYHYAWDEEKRTFAGKPAHDWSSHTADAMRYAALYTKRAEVLRRPKQKPSREIQPPKYTLDDLFEENERGRA